MASNRNPLTWIVGACGLLAVGGSAQAQFTNNTSDIPTGGAANSSRSENVDFGDVDLDGDWDAVFADGGDADQDQNRIWINRGPGANLGKFQDETSSRFPAINDQSRDIEFVDFDNDSDLDIYISNTAALVAQGNRWWTNQGVGTGTYVDETAARWVNLNGPNSSLAPSQVLASGTFIDFSCDCDFADIDNDGDMDLFHSSYGGVFGGQVPSRIYLNDGNGFFEEFNPSGFKLSGQTIQSGNPGLWCEGTQQSDTTNSNGTFCDIASSALDIDFGDIDGDFDLDVLHGARQEAPRMFENRLEENGGVLGFRDVTGAVFPSGYTSGNGHYEQEMGDLDGDGDLDIYGLNWLASFGFTDITLRNDGNGTFSNIVTLSGSSADDNEGDFLDYDNDGDLDLFVANFSGQDKLYRNNNNGGSSFSFTEVSFPTSNQTALDADCCDVDGDGDYDILVANDFNAANRLFTNTTNIPDTHAPYLPNIEQAPDRAAGAAPTVVRVHVYDNAPYYITWYNPTQLNYRVNGGGVTSVAALSSGGQVFRGEIPGTLTGTIEYWFTSSDEYGNTGQSPTRSFTATGGGNNTGSAYCFGDGSGTACPCGAVGLPGEGCPNSGGLGGATLTGAGNAALSNDTFQLQITGVPGAKPGIILRGANQVNGGNGNPVGEGLLCAGGQSARSSVKLTSAAGAVTFTEFRPGQSFGSQSYGAGVPANYQFWYRDTANTCNGGGFNFTNGWTVTWQN
jgi:hypothetical protein